MRALIIIKNIVRGLIILEIALERGEVCCV
jgi:hypothetical protein